MTRVQGVYVIHGTYLYTGIEHDQSIGGICDPWDRLIHWNRT